MAAVLTSENGRRPCPSELGRAAGLGEHEATPASRHSVSTVGLALAARGQDLLDHTFERHIHLYINIEPISACIA